MKIINLAAPKKLPYQYLLKLKSLFRRIMAAIYENCNASISSPPPIKIGGIICSILIHYCALASNPGKESKQNNQLNSNIAPKISHLSRTPRSNSSSIYKVPFTLRYNLILIEAVVGDKKGLLLLDTGTEPLILNQKYFSGNPSSTYIIGIHDDMLYPQRKPVTVQISNLPDHKIDAFITNLSHLEEPLQMELLGICGFDFLQRFQWVINYHERFISFYSLDKSGNLLDKSTLPPPSEILRLQKEAGILSVNVRVDDLKMNLALDTGTSSTVIDKKSKSSLVAQAENLVEIDHKSNAVGINGSREMIPSFALSHLKIGQTNVPTIQVTFMDLNRINRGRYWKLDGIFNPLFLCHGIVGINWKKKQLYIWKHNRNPSNTSIESDHLLADVDRVRE